MFTQARRRPARQSAQGVHFPAPSGLNRILPAGAMPLERGTLLYNLVGAEYGDRVRLGYREWVTGIFGDSGTNEVRSILPFMGSTAAKSRLFACTNYGIFDVTTSFRGSGTAWVAATAYAVGDRIFANNTRVYVCVTAGTSAGAGPGPVGTGVGIVDGTAAWDFVATFLALDFVDVTGAAGYGTCHTFVNTAGNHFLIYCDEVNGMFVYTESTDTWAPVTMGGGATQISGVDPASFVHVAGFKQRLWFTQRDSAQAWYLAAGALYGAATAFNFGSKFKAGGSLRCLTNNTYDGGAGMDDSLIAISDGGDVAIYQGVDPSSATSFNIRGVWSVGAIPAGRSITTDFGGDTLILSKSGAIPVSTLALAKSGLEQSQYVTYEISPLFNQLMLASSSLKGWSLRLHPEENALIVTVPTTAGVATNQLAMSLATKGWSQYRDLPMFSNAVWNGKLYFGTTDGKVCVNDGYVDGVTLADPNTYTDITWSLLTAFQNLGNARQKQVKTIRPSFRCDGGIPSYAVAARYRYDLTEIGSVAAGTVGGNVWDAGIWDTATWAGEYSTLQQISGAAGMGPEFAIAAKGTARARTVVIGFDVTFDMGGFL